MTTVIPLLSQASGIPPATAFYDQPSAAYAQREHDALHALRAAAAAHPGRIVQATSLGVEDMVLTDLIARHGLPIAVATLDTGALHDETLDLVGRTERHYAIRVEVWRPDAAAVERFVAANGADAMYRSVELRHTLRRRLAVAKPGEHRGQGCHHANLHAARPRGTPRAVGCFRSASSPRQHAAFVTVRHSDAVAAREASR